jgi:hypothetical protein
MVASREYHVFAGASTVIAENAPHEKCWRVKYIDWRREDYSASGVLTSVSSAPLDSRFDKQEFETAEAAIASFLYRLACGWFKGQTERLSRVIPRDAGMFQAALDHFREARPKTVKEVRMRAVSMAKSLSIWGEMMFPEEETRMRIKGLLGV